MAKAIVCIGDTSTNNGIPVISYSVSVIGLLTYSYTSDYEVNTNISLTNNLLAWRNKVIAQAAERNITLLAADIVVFGGPS